MGNRIKKVWIEGSFMTSAHHSLTVRLFLDLNLNLTTTYCVGSTIGTQDGSENTFPFCFEIAFCSINHKMLYSLI